jgi:hypothetical protein
MAKISYPEINVKAAIITGGFLGLLFWLVGLTMGFAGMPMYGFMSGMMGYYMVGYSSFVGVYFIFLIVIGAILGLLIAMAYNWALKLK